MFSSSMAGLPEETLATEGRYQMFPLRSQQHAFHLLCNMEQSDTDIFGRATSMVWKKTNAKSNSNDEQHNAMDHAHDFDESL
jgi:hypothetical protein